MQRNVTWILSLCRFVDGQRANGFDGDFFVIANISQSYHMAIVKCEVFLGISLNFYSFGHFLFSFEHFTMSGWRWRTRLENQKRQKLFKSDVSKILNPTFRNISSFYEKCSILFELKTENMKICHRLLLKVGKYLEFRNQNFTGDHCMKSLFTFLLWLPPDRRGVVDRSK